MTYNADFQNVPQEIEKVQSGIREMEAAGRRAAARARLRQRLQDFFWQFVTGLFTGAGIYAALRLCEHFWGR